MKKYFPKRVCGCMLAMMLCVVMVLTGTGVTVCAGSVSWNFKNSSFKSLGTISSTVTVDDLTLIATSSKTMEVKADTQTVSDTEYTYCLALGGGGTTSYRSVKVPVNGNGTLKVVLKSSGSSDRSLVVADGSGNELTTLSAGTTASLETYSYSGDAGYIYLYSAGSGINIYKIQMDDATSSSSSGSTTDTSDGTVVTSFSELVSAVDAAESAGGGTVYVQGTSIDCSAQLALSTSNANVSIVGVQNSDGSYPVLDFSTFREAYIGTSTSDSAVGIRITGSYYTLQNLIVQKAPDNGIQIKGSSAGNNVVQDCIVRYNNDAGLQITNGAYGNTIRFVYSYRNCDVYTLGGNADGFAPKLAAGTGNTFYGCYAWENSDDGWDSYDKTDGLTYDLTYEECATWNNGNPTIFTGEYDFNNGDDLDTDLLLVELIMEQSSSFATNYANGSFSLPSGKFISTSDGTISLSTWTGDSYDGNPNGFKFGSVNTTSSCVRTVKNCLSFGNSSKGFDNNNSACTASFNNCIAFDNGYNYYISPFTLTAFNNIYGFSGSSSDKLPSGYSVQTPSSGTQASIRSTVSDTVETITTNCKNNVISEVYFDIYD